MTIASLLFFKPRHATALALTAALASSVSVANAEDSTAPAASPAKTEKCLLINLIRQTRVIDDKTVLFYYSHNDIYKNALPHKCSGLGIDKAFAYKSSINQLCSVDTITPLVSSGGAYMEYSSCGLGSFERIDKATAEKLISDAKPGH